MLRKYKKLKELLPIILKCLKREKRNNYSVCKVGQLKSLVQPIIPIIESLLTENFSHRHYRFILILQRTFFVEKFYQNLYFEDILLAISKINVLHSASLRRFNVHRYLLERAVGSIKK